MLFAKLLAAGLLRNDQVGHHKGWAGFALLGQHVRKPCQSYTLLITISTKNGVGVATQ